VLHERWHRGYLEPLAFHHYLPAICIYLDLRPRLGRRRRVRLRDYGQTTSPYFASTS
jgi:hypothetical protein